MGEGHAKRNKSSLTRRTACHFGVHDGLRQHNALKPCAGSFPRLRVPMVTPLAQQNRGHGNTTVIVTYRDPKTGETWSGRGRRMARLLPAKGESWREG